MAAVDPTQTASVGRVLTLKEMKKSHLSKWRSLLNHLAFIHDPHRLKLWEICARDVEDTAAAVFVHKRNQLYPLCFNISCHTFFFPLPNPQNYLESIPEHCKKSVLPGDFTVLTISKAHSGFVWIETNWKNTPEGKKVCQCKTCPSSIRTRFCMVSHS